MRWFCEEARLDRAAQSWRTTTLLFVVIYLIPLGLCYLAGCVSILIGRSFHFELGPLGLLLLPVFAVPLIHLFMSTSRMARSAREPPPFAGHDVT